ncbi:MAG: hypothetical protein AAFX44_15405 [Pseudomonadota bacterium]
MLTERSGHNARTPEFTAVLLLAPAAIALALLALMVLFLGTTLDAIASLRHLLLIWSSAATLWLGSIALRPNRSVRNALSHLPAWCWVAGCALLVLAALAGLALAIAASLVATPLADPLLATYALIVSVVSFWLAYGTAFPDGRAVRYAGPRAES